jgi:hypothetical protein
MYDKHYWGVSYVCEALKWLSAQGYKSIDEYIREQHLVCSIFRGKPP